MAGADVRNDDVVVLSSASGTAINNIRKKMSLQKLQLWAFIVRIIFALGENPVAIEVPVVQEIETASRISAVRGPGYRGRSDHK